MKVIYYFNINYDCNNNCLFCLSPSTYIKKNPMKYEDILSWIEKNSMLNDSRIIINGGEPTIHKEIIDIIKLFSDKGAEIVLYSNGRRFSDYFFAQQIVLSGVNRITIPIHGDIITHDYFTQVKGSYLETIKGIKNISKLKYEVDVDLEIKLIITNEVIKKNFNIVDSLEENGIRLDMIDNLIISGLIESKISKNNNVYIPEDKLVGIYVSNFINYIKKEDKKINLKIEDIKLCFLDESIINEIRNKINIKYPIYKEFYFFDSKYNKGKIINYNKNTHYFYKCNMCSLNQLCGSIMDRYQILIRYSNGYWGVDLE